MYHIYIYQTLLIRVNPTEVAVCAYRTYSPYSCLSVRRLLLEAITYYSSTQSTLTNYLVDMYKYSYIYQAVPRANSAKRVIMCYVYNSAYSLFLEKRRHPVNVLSMRTHLVDAFEALLEVRLHPVDVLRLGQDGEQLVVRQEVQAGEHRPLRLKVVAQPLLNLVQKLRALSVQGKVSTNQSGQNSQVM